MELSYAKDIATIAGVAVAIGTLLKAIFEYNRNSALRRMEYFAKMKDEFLGDTSFSHLTALLEGDDTQLAEMPAREKWRYLVFFEEVALLLRARLIHKEVACYMFGYYALQCDRSRSFWSSSFPKDQAYWLLFFDFVGRMSEVEKSKHANPEAFARRLRA